MSTDRFSSLPRRVKLRTKLVAVTTVLVAFITGIIVLSARSATIDRQRALVDNVAGRQPMLVERYVGELVLGTAGVTTDAAGTEATLIHDADALLDGGAVLAVQGNDLQVHLPAQTDPVIRAKLTEFRRMVDQLTAAGDVVREDRPGTTSYTTDLAHLEALSHVTANVGHDAVGRMTAVAERDVRSNARHQMYFAAAGILLAIALSWLLGRRIVHQLLRMADLARATAAGDLAARFPVSSDDEIGQLGRALNEMAESLSGVLTRLESDAARESFGSQLVEAFEMADNEDAAYRVAGRAMAQIAPDIPAELLLADSSQAHLQRVATHPTAGGPGCPVESPYGCVAVRRGSATVFETSEALNSCAKLSGRAGGPCSAVCVPVTFMGKALGVLHVTAPPERPIPADRVTQLGALAAQAGSRIGTIRAFTQSQLQASTDGLTGLINRRSFENEARNLLRDGERFAIALGDLDHFKVLNDTFGHEGGDRALRLFAQTMRHSLRDGDLVARYGGEEFVFVFRGLTENAGGELLDRLRFALADAVALGGSPAFTASFGITDSIRATTLDELLRLADDALLAAKRQGRNRVVVASTKPTAAVTTPTLHPAG